MKNFIDILSDVYSRTGVWIQTVATLTLFTSFSFLDGPTGWVFFALSAIVIVSDPVVLVLSARSRGARVQSGYLATVVLIVVAVAAYAIRTKLNLTLDTVADADDAWLTRLRRLLLALFLFSYAGFFVYRLFICIGENATRIQGSADIKRRQMLQKSLISIFAALPLFVLANYLTTVRNPTIDMSPGYYSFGEASRTILKSVPVDVEATVFLPEMQAMKDSSQSKTQPELFRIAEDVRVMADQLPVINGHFKLKYRNADMDLVASQDFGSVNNGTFVFRVMKQGLTTGDNKPYIERRVYVFNESDMERLEREIVRAAIQVSSPEKNVYFTAANGERWDVPGRVRSPGAIETMKDALRFMNFTLKPLDSQNSWPGPIPKDADALVIAGPTVSFSPEARTAVLDYLKRGGKVLASINPAGPEDMSWLLEAADSHLRFKNAFLSSEAVWPGIPITDSLETHRITENLSVAGRAFIAFPECGYFAEGSVPSAQPQILQENNQKMKQTIFLYTKFNTVVDTNRDGRKEPGEESGRFPLGVAFEYPDHKGARLVVYSGIGWMTELGLRFPIDQRNIILAQDSLSFLMENPIAAGLVPEQRKTRSIPVTEGLKFRNFILGVVAFPLSTVLLTLGGVWLYRRRRKK
ncbi:MAG TPA: Gldg family protein [Leptospiraceae bacterium]|nr:GldG family protein [Leptospirales bacterium]HMU82577.1 Gldg family protein [Leptospiraceae bacterium]HMW58515.1 Gldg family protein [Leptospiraceae bacterium]HMX55126.1 Gldg family protein [Leptospiraceae bacterium]HNE23376.1 Gldg family protein [Leptospiraceae bacterium]